MAGANISVCPQCGSTQTRVRIFESHMEARGECKACLYKGPKVKASVRGDLPLACEVAMELFSTDVERDEAPASATVDDIVDVLLRYMQAICNMYPHCGSDGCPLSPERRDEELPFGCDEVTGGKVNMRRAILKRFPTMDWS